MDYGRPLLEECVRESRISIERPIVPRRWIDYRCDDYFHEGWAERGHLHEPSQTLAICPLAEAYEIADIEFFAVGRSGWDGIDFGFRKGRSGLWAFRPIDRDFKFMAATVAELVEGWCSSRLSV